MTMDRRSFLTGVAATAIATKLPRAAVPVDIEFTVTIVPTEPYSDWRMATAEEIFADVQRMIAFAQREVLEPKYIWASKEAHDEICRAAVPKLLPHISFVEVS